MNTASRDRWYRDPQLLTGFTLMSFYLLQSQTVIGINIADQWQNSPTYRQISGFVLLTFFALQWYMIRNKRNANAKTVRQRHIHWGIWAPLLLFAHSTTLGYGYQILLVAFFLITVLSGLLHPQRLKLRGKYSYPAWPLLHVSCAATLRYYWFFICISSTATTRQLGSEVLRTDRR